MLLILRDGVSDGTGEAGCCVIAPRPAQVSQVGTWKRDLTGRGNSDKAAVMAAVQNLGYAPETQDEADALGVLHHVGDGSC